MNMQELGQLGMAYKVKSRAGVTAALHRVASAADLDLDNSPVVNLSNEEFWKQAQSIMDKIVVKADSEIRKLWVDHSE